MISDRARILIVDDNPVLCDVLQDELSERGYQCTTVLDGNGALVKLANQDFDAILLDIRLPGISGMEVLRKIRLEHEKTVTIMVTAVDDVATAVEAMKLGASEYITKPFDLDAMDASIHAALKAKRAGSKPSSEMDAIASGVEVELDPFSTYSKMITERTVDVARKLGIDEEEIQHWVANRSVSTRYGIEEIKSTLRKLERSAFAQLAMGVMEPYLYVPNFTGNQN